MVWTLVVVKFLAAGGLVAGLWIPGVAATVVVGVVCYFLCAVVAHVRVGFMGLAPAWLSCLTCLTLAVATGVVSFLL